MPPNGSVGTACGTEPVARTRCPARTRIVASVVSTLTVLPSSISAVPDITDTPLLFRRPGDPACQAVHDRVLPFDRAREIKLHLPDAQAERRRFALAIGGVERIRSMDKRLGRDAADIQAGTAQGGALDQDGRNPNCPARMATT